MSHDDCPQIAGYPARWSLVELPAPSGEADDRKAFAASATATAPEAPSLHAYLVDQPETLFDQEALLRSEEVPEPPYWALVWIGARALAAHLSNNPPEKPDSVLDLGCGLGISGVAAALHGAQVTFVDYVPECLEFVRASVERHGIANARILCADFTRDDLGQRFQRIVAADIVYDPAAYDPLADFLERHLADGGEILLTESLRADAKHFITNLKQRGFDDQVDAIWIEEDGKPERTWLHQLRRRESS